MNNEKALTSAKAYRLDEKEGWKIAEEQGVEVIELSEEEKAEWKEILKPVSESWVEKTEKMGYESQKIYDRALELKSE